MATTPAGIGGRFGWVCYSPPMADLRLKVLTSIHDVEKMAWNALLRPDDAPVLRHEWISAMEASGSAVPERGWVATHFTVWRENTLVAAAPAYQKMHSMGEYVYDFGWANAAQQLGVDYYPKLLVGLPLSPLTARRFLVAEAENETALRRSVLSAMSDFARDANCSSIHVLFPPEPEANALEHEGFFRRRTMQYHWQNPGYATFEDYLSRFDSKRRNQIKRERGAAHGQALSLRTVRSHELTTQHAQLAWRFYEATASRHSWGPVQLTQAFFHHAFAAMPDAIELVVAQKRDGEIVAGAFNLYNSTRLFGRYWGCFEEFPFLHFNVCLYHSIDDAIQRGLQAFEPGAGGEHKISRGFEPTEIHSAHRIFNRRLEAAVKDFCLREGQQVSLITSDSASIAGLKPWKNR
jgi:predicted N-acyltransferase